MAGHTKIWIGIDVGKAAHHACAVDETGKAVFTQRLINDQTAIEQVIARAGQAAGEVQWAVDMTARGAQLLTTLLLTTRQPVAYVPGRVVNRMAAAFAGEGKTDAKDAKVIAETARLRSDLTPLTSSDEIVADLRVLTAHRADLMDDWVRGVNRLRELLASIFPALERAFDYSTRSALILLTGFQTPPAVRDAGRAELARYLTEHGAWARCIKSIVDKSLTAASEQTVVLPAEHVTASLTARLAGQLLDLDREIKQLDKQIAARLAGHPWAEILTSVPGIGPLLSAEFLVATGGDLDTFGTSARLAAYAGLVPVPRDSGRVQGNLHRPKRYHRGLRRVFYMAAINAIKTEGPSRAFYQRKRHEGKRHNQGIIALARRLVDLLWALLRDQRLFTTMPPETAQAA